MRCPHCNKEIDTDSEPDKKDPFAPSDKFAQMCKPTKNMKEGF